MAPGNHSRQHHTRLPFQGLQWVTAVDRLPLYRVLRVLKLLLKCPGRRSGQQIRQVLIVLRPVKAEGSNTGAVIINKAGVFTQAKALSHHWQANLRRVRLYRPGPTFWSGCGSSKPNQRK